MRSATSRRVVRRSATSWRVGSSSRVRPSARYVDSTWWSHSCTNPCSASTMPRPALPRVGHDGREAAATEPSEAAPRVAPGTSEAAVAVRRVQRDHRVDRTMRRQQLVQDRPGHVGVQPPATADPGQPANRPVRGHDRRRARAGHCRRSRRRPRPEPGRASRGTHPARRPTSRGGGAASRSGHRALARRGPGTASVRAGESGDRSHRERSGRCSREPVSRGGTVSCTGSECPRIDSPAVALDYYPRVGSTTLRTGRPPIGMGRSGIDGVPGTGGSTG